MKIFIDTAKIDEIKQAYSLGILDGVTTNPSLIKQAVDELKSNGKAFDMKSYIKEILQCAKGTPVSLEVIGTTYAEMVEEGVKLFNEFNPVASNVCIKIPVNPSLSATDAGSDDAFDGIRAIKALSSQGIPVNCTLVMAPEQALLAAKAGAKFVSPFAGRTDDYLRELNKLKFNKTDYFPSDGLGDVELPDDNGIFSGIDLISQCVEIFSNYSIKTEVLAASIRNSRQLRECALAGADVATVPLYVIKDSLHHCKTLEGMKKFVKDIVPEYQEVLKK